MGQADELVVEEGGRLRGGTALARLISKPPRDFRAAGRERLCQDLPKFGVELLARAHGGDLVGDSPAVDDRPAVVDVEEAIVAREPLQPVQLFQGFARAEAVGFDGIERGDKLVRTLLRLGSRREQRQIVEAGRDAAGCITSRLELREYGARAANDRGRQAGELRDCDP